MSKIIYPTIVKVIKGVKQEIKTIIGLEKETEELVSLAQLKKNAK